jgi:hypothetical protein
VFVRTVVCVCVHVNALFSLLGVCLSVDEMRSSDATNLRFVFAGNNSYNSMIILCNFAVLAVEL